MKWSEEQNALELGRNCNLCTLCCRLCGRQEIRALLAGPRLEAIAELVRRGQSWHLFPLWAMHSPRGRSVWAASLFSLFSSLYQAWLAQSVEHENLNLKVVGSSPGHVGRPTFTKHISFITTVHVQLPFTIYCERAYYIRTSLPYDSVPWNLQTL